MSTQDIFSEIEVLEALQEKELTVYKTFLKNLKTHLSLLMPQLNDMNILNDIMTSKQNMMDEITAIEEEISPIRKEISKIANNVEKDKIDSIKNKDIEIIETISQISKEEQHLTKQIQQKMQETSERLKEIGNINKIKSEYGHSHPSKISINTQSESEKKFSSYFDFSG
jgi:seryl-tRNA synthetase